MNSERDDASDDLLKRADALLARHRGATRLDSAAAAPDLPALDEPAAQAATDDDIPTLTEVIPAGELPAILSPSRSQAPGPAA